MVLTVDPPRRFLEPDSPNSTDQLIGPQSPDLDQLQKTTYPCSSGSRESLSSKRPDPSKQQPFYKKMFNYDLVTKPAANRAAGEKRESKDGDTDQPSENDALIPQVPTKPDSTNQKTIDRSPSSHSVNDVQTSSSNGDSGQSSLENLSSQGDSPNEPDLGISSTPACPPSRASQHQAAAVIAAANIARSRPLPKRPFKKNISLDRGKASSKGNKTDSSAQQTSVANTTDHSWSTQPYENVPPKGSSSSNVHQSKVASSPSSPAAAATTADSDCDNNQDPGDSGVVVDFKSGSVLEKVELSNQNWL